MPSSPGGGGSLLPQLSHSFAPDVLIVPHAGQRSGSSVLGSPLHLPQPIHIMPHMIEVLVARYHFEGVIRIWDGLSAIFSTKSPMVPYDITPAWQCFTHVGVLPFWTLSAQRSH